MSKEASTHLIVLEPSEDLIASEPWSVDTYAEGLMDELFADIDQILDGRGDVSSQRLQQTSRRLTAMESVLMSHNQPEDLALEFVGRHSVSMPQIVLPETIIQQVQIPPRNQQQNTVLVDPTTVRKQLAKRVKWWQTLGKLLTEGVGLGLVVAAVVWVVNTGLLNRIITQSYQLSVSKPQHKILQTKTDETADLVDYVLGALAAIDRQQTSNNQKSAKTLLSNVASTNQTALAYVSDRRTAIPPAPSRSTTVVERRIYIPVYQAPQPMRYAPPPLISTIKVPPVPAPNKTTPNASKPTVVKTAYTPPKPAKPVNVQTLATVKPEIKPVVQTTPVTVKLAPKPMPAPPVARSPVAPSKPPAQQPTPSSTQQQVVAVLPASSVSVPAYILEGLLELGDKSAALFKIDGVSHRVVVGESIGASGWTLVEVAKGEAIIRRNGEVRSIYTGQKF